MTLEVKGLKKSFKDVEALKSLDFTLEPGRATALLGPNGAGKSTAIKILTTLLKPDAGEILFDGKDLLKQPAAMRDLIGYVSQAMAMDKIMTGLEFMRFCAGLHHLDWRIYEPKARDLLIALGLQEAQDRRVGTYSGGMQRRLDLATALLNEPKVLILDEPTTGLDIEAREKIWAMIAEFVGNGGSLILASHDFREVDELTQDILILDKGAVVRRGTREALKKQLGAYVVHVKTREFMTRAEVAQVKQAFASWPEKLAWYGDDETVAFAFQTDADMRTTQDRIYQQLSGMNVVSLNLRTPELEDVYRFAVGGAE